MSRAMATAADDAAEIEWVVEELHADYAQSLRVERMLYDSKTKHQRIKVFENARFGRVLTLDDVVQTTEADEPFYHEMLVHPAMLAHGTASRVLIIGGGDGGVLREVLRYPRVSKVVMVEIDRGVVEFSKQHLPNHSAGAFDDPRLTLKITDGAKFVEKNRGKYDVIIVDSTDPHGPGAALFTDQFYGHCKERLKKGGILVTQNGVPFLQPDELANTMRSFQALFADWGCYLVSVPTYVGGQMALGWACDNPRRRAIGEKQLQQRFDEIGLETTYYTPAVHKAAFALPAYIEKLLPDR